MLYFIYMYISRSTSLVTPTVKCFHSTPGRCKSTFLGCCILHMAKTDGKGGGIQWLCLSLYTVSYAFCHWKQIKQNKEGINKYTNTELAHIVHVHGIGTRVLVILGPAVYHTYECCWSTADGEDAEPVATEWAGTVRGTAH